MIRQTGSFFLNQHLPGNKPEERVAAVAVSVNGFKQLSDRVADN
jgi:hypothetical protein